MSKTPLNCVILYGSYRPNPLGMRAVRYLQQKGENEGHKMVVVDAKSYNLPILAQRHMDYASMTSRSVEDEAVFTQLEKISAHLKAADGFIVVAGEYNHSVQPGLKNLIDYFYSEYFYKPAGVVVYSVGRFGGGRGVSNLKVILNELGMVTVPSMMYMPQLDQMMDEKGEDKGAFQDSAKKFLGDWAWYTSALKTARLAGLPA